MKILVTGAAGFIGYHLCRRLMKTDAEITGIDSMNSYYDVELKNSRLEKLEGLDFRKLDMCCREEFFSLLEERKFDVVCNLAAQAGVRYSIENPYTYVENNISAFLNLLEGCRRAGTKNIVYASSSSVYGRNREMPFTEAEKTDSPASLYAATKKADELMAHVYADMYGMNLVGLRFFTVYGPLGRPDMAYFKFAKKITEGKPIDVYNFGEMKRDFTYVDDVTEGVERILFSDFGSFEKCRIYNIGRGKPEKLSDMISFIEEGLGRKAELNLMPMQSGDVLETFADISALERDYGYAPSTDLKVGLNKFIEWFKGYNS